MSEELFTFGSGVIAAGFVIAALFFLRFWRLTHDTLFLAFAVAFLLFAANQTLSTFLGENLEERSWTYLLRLAGFVFIIIAILGKSLARSKSS